MTELLHSSVNSTKMQRKETTDAKERLLDREEGKSEMEERIFKHTTP